MMDVDLSQLPIPDWDLICPRCRYPLKGLPAHRCPECGVDLDIPALVRSWTRLREPTFSGRELPVPDFGVACRACRAGLAGATRSQCSVCAAPFDLSELRPAKTWFHLEPVLCRGIAMPIVQMLLEADQIPFVAFDGRNIIEICLGTRAIGARLLVPSEFYFDTLYMLRRHERQMQLDRAHGGRLPWRCPRCRQSVPANFDICWKCQAERPTSA